MSDVRETANVTSGALVDLMRASSKDIKTERANQVLSNVHNQFKQKIDSVYATINELNIKKTDLMHKLVPKTTIDTSFDVNAVDYVDKNMSILKDLKDAKIWFEALKEEYFLLFHKQYVEPESFF